MTTRSYFGEQKSGALRDVRMGGRTYRMQLHEEARCTVQPAYQLVVLIPM